MIDHQNATPTRGFPVVSLIKPRAHLHAWVSDTARLPGRHRVAPGRKHVSAIAGVQLARGTQRIGGGTSAGSLLARLTGGVR